MVKNTPPTVLAYDEYPGDIHFLRRQLAECASQSWRERLFLPFFGGAAQKKTQRISLSPIRRLKYVGPSVDVVLLAPSI